MGSNADDFEHRAAKRLRKEALYKKSIKVNPKQGK